MARVICPYGYPDDYGRKVVCKVPLTDGGFGVIYGQQTVEIKRGICEDADRCGKKECPFYDRSREATQVFWEALTQRYTLEGLQNKKADNQLDIEIYETLVDQYGLRDLLEKNKNPELGA